MFPPLRRCTLRNCPAIMNIIINHSNGPMACTSKTFFTSYKARCYPQLILHQHRILKRLSGCTIHYKLTKRRPFTLACVRIPSYRYERAGSLGSCHILCYVLYNSECMTSYITVNTGTMDHTALFFCFVLVLLACFILDCLLYLLFLFFLRKKSYRYVT